jgi:hypothetical protein
MVIDFIHFLAMFAIAMTLLRLGQAQFAGTEFGKVLAFFG